MSQDSPLPPKALLVGSGVHLASARLMLCEAGFVVADEITHPGTAHVFLDALESDSDINVALVLFILSETYRLTENRVIGELRVEYDQCKIVCVGSPNDWHRHDALTALGVSAYLKMTESWVSDLYTKLVELRKEIEAS